MTLGGNNGGFVSCSQVGSSVNADLVNSVSWISCAVEHLITAWHEHEGVDSIVLIDTRVGVVHVSGKIHAEDF